jgi:hypothetical protein
LELYPSLYLLLYHILSGLADIHTPSTRSLLASKCLWFYIYYCITGYSHINLKLLRHNICAEHIRSVRRSRDTATISAWHKPSPIHLPDCMLLDAFLNEYLWMLCSNEYIVFYRWFHLVIRKMVQ